MLSEVEFLVVGAGPCGLGAARQLERCGVTSWLLVDAAPGPGGLASSFVDTQGFTWDVGGHVQFSHYDYIDEAMDEFLGDDGWNVHEREAWVWIRGRFVPYPFQYNLHRLPPADRDRCVRGLLDRTGTSTPSHFGEWIRARFGDGIAEVFMEPYNTKVWAYPPDVLSTGWMGERVPDVEVDRVLANVATGTDDVSWGPNNTFRFPKRGGTGAIWQACARRLPQDQLRFGECVDAIDLAARQVTLSSGHRVGYRHLISTMPLTELLRVSELRDFDDVAAEGLLHSSSNIVGLGMRGTVPEALRSKCWLYFPESDAPFYRATVLSNYADANAPRPGETWSLMCEVSESSYRPVDHDTLLDSVVSGALATGLVPSASDLVSTWVYRAPYGYPTPGLQRDRALAEIIPALEQHGVFSRGRFGMWKYEVSNQDHSFMQGVEIVERLVNGRAEITAFDAEHANSCRHPWPFERWGS
jgi:hypothetical protein